MQTVKKYINFFFFDWSGGASEAALRAAFRKNRYTSVDVLYDKIMAKCENNGDFKREFCKRIDDIDQCYASRNPRNYVDTDDDFYDEDDYSYSDDDYLRELAHFIAADPDLLDKKKVRKGKSCKFVKIVPPI